jgi:drug/metabolite transporter (DMT)-like permease
MLKSINRHYLLLHFIVFIWGFSPILGRYITADAWQLVWFRILITVVVIFAYLKITRQDLRISREHFFKLSGIGLIVMIHWLTFYGAIKVSNVSVTMVAFSTGTLFSSLLEPFFFKRKIRIYELIIGLIIISAIALIFSIQTEYWLGIVLGIIAAFTSALFGVFNGIMAHKLRPGLISFYELTSALLGLSLFVWYMGDFKTEFFVLDNRSIIGILILSLVCTVFPFISTVNLSKFISPYTIVLTVNLETVYGILWAIFIYQENKEVEPSFYFGVLIILSAIFLNSYLRKRNEQRSDVKNMI